MPFGYGTYTIGNTLVKVIEAKREKKSVTFSLEFNIDVDRRLHSSTPTYFVIRRRLLARDNIIYVWAARTVLIL